MKYIYLKKVLRVVSENPFRIFKIIFNRLICTIRSIYYSSYINEGDGKIIITEPFLKFKITKHKTAKLCLNGILSVTSHIGGSTQSAITMAPKSNLQILGDFLIGNGVLIYLHNNACLKIGGKFNETNSGITSDSSIMVYKNIEIGKDFLCSWNVFISDSDWHSIEGQNHQANIFIGNHVWIANNSSVLKGSVINDNSIVASHTKISGKEFCSNSLIAGTPGKVIKKEVKWCREIRNK